MNKNRIRLTESQLHNLIKKSVKSFINEGGHLTWKDDDGRMHTNSRHTWYGVEGSTFVSHGEWSDGEIYFDYQGEQYVINAYEAEQWLWNDFKDYCQENNLNPDEHTDDEIWENFASSEAYEVLLNLGPYNENYEMNESKKRKVRLTESQLHSVIKESVRQMLSELNYKTYDNAAGKLYQKAREGFGQYEPSNEIPFDSEHGNLFKRAEDLKDMANKRFIEDYGEANYKTNPKGSEEFLNVTMNMNRMEEGGI